MNVFLYRYINDLPSNKVIHGVVRDMHMIHGYPYSIICQINNEIVQTIHRNSRRIKL